MGAAVVDLDLGARVMRGPLGREARMADGPWVITRDLRNQRGVWVVALEGDPGVSLWAYPEQLTEASAPAPATTQKEGQ